MHADNLTNFASGLGLPQASGPLGDLKRQVSNLSSVMGSGGDGPAEQSMAALAQEIVEWMGIGNVIMSQGQTLPPPSKRLPGDI